MSKRADRRNRQSLQQDGDLDYRNENSFNYSEGEYPLSDNDNHHYVNDYDRRDAGGMQM